jgi:hypothetical protein
MEKNKFINILTLIQITKKQSTATSNYVLATYVAGPASIDRMLIERKCLYLKLNVMHHRSVQSNRVKRSVIEITVFGAWCCTANRPVYEAHFSKVTGTAFSKILLPRLLEEQAYSSIHSALDRGDRSNSLPSALPPRKKSL